MNRRTRPFVISLVVSITGIACQSSDAPTVAAAVTDTDYRVYSAFLNTREFYRNVPIEDAVILYDSTTISPSDVNPETSWTWVTTHLGDRCRYYRDEDRCRKAQDPAWAPLFDALKQSTNQRSLPLQAKFSIHYPTRVLSRKQLREVGDGDEDRHPNYYVFGLSNVMYNSNKTKALFFSSCVCGGTCGRGELVMLEKAAQTWILIDTFRFWIA